MIYRLVLACAFVAVVAGHFPCLAESPGLPAATTVAALPFQNASGEERYAPLAAAVGDMLMARLSDAEGLVFVERTAIDKVLKEQAFSAQTGAAEQARVGRLVGARFVLVGSVTAAGNAIQIAAQLLEVASARVARSAKVTAQGDRLVQAVDDLARSLTEGLNLKLPVLAEAEIDKSPEASVHFMRGLGYYYAGMPEEAAVQFLKALAADPSHAEARYYSGMNYFDQAEYEHARIEFTRFLQQFGDHRLAGRAREMLRQCEAKLGHPTEGGTP